MIKAYVDAFAAQIDTLTDGEVGPVTDVLCRLMAVACGGEAGEQGQAIRLGRLAEANRYVGLHLADPDLTPETAASALKISVRLLHLLFEPSGTTFTDYVVKRRLEECRAALETGERSVTDIAFAWGFNSLATFFRRFREAYGMTPCEMRHQAVRRNWTASFQTIAHGFGSVPSPTGDGTICGEGMAHESSAARPRASAAQGLRRRIALPGGPRNGGKKRRAAICEGERGAIRASRVNSPDAYPGRSGPVSGAIPRIAKPSATIQGPRVFFRCWRTD